MKIAMVTGPSSGIGLATAVEMARLGYHVVAAGRSETRTMEVVTAITSDGGSAEFLQLDLASLEQSRQAAENFVSSGRALDVLIANAGVGGIRDVSADGFEIHFAVNHLGHFMLTHHLEPSFEDGTRIVVVSSEVHRRADGIDFDRVRRKTRSVFGLSEYGVSKLANVLFARRLAQLRPEWRTYSLHPGVADTNIFPAIARPFFRNRKPAHEAARTSVWCSTSEELAAQSGLYYSKMKERDPSPTAQDDELASELWVRSEELCGLAPQV